MKVLLINGSPNQSGCTYTALSEVAGALNGSGVETSFFHIGKKPIQGCVACKSCKNTGRCAFDDEANVCADLIRAADGLVVGSPVYFASANGSLCAFLDRVFYVGLSSFRYKPAAAVVSSRRGGALTTFDRINKYFTISEMPVVSSQYWNEVHGSTPDEVRQDLEGLQIMRTLGKNMAWVLKNFENGKKIPLPEQEPRLRTNFIRQPLNI
ncbi:MAG: flavodoxin family protein [Synergistaceae bacterium]|jgi:multimeric flavodoxin WrbA|nr:flavodoxin family protein [Synergistaceae bacterium]